MGSIEKRLEALERTYGAEPEVDSAEMARRRRELKARWPNSEEKAAMEPARRIALEAFEEQMRKRIRTRGL